MELKMFLLADHAESANGKMYMVGGGWDRMFAAGFPTVHAHLSVASVLSVGWQETNDPHQFELRLVDAEGQELQAAKIQGQFELGRPPGMRPGDETLVPLVFNENNLTFDKAGNYTFELLLDGTRIGNLPFKVAALQPQTVTR